MTVIRSSFTQRRTFQKRKVSMRQNCEGSRRCSPARPHHFRQSGAGRAGGSGARSAGPSTARCHLRAHSSDRRRCDVEGGQCQGGRSRVRPGCGDGRIPVTAAKLGARAVCIDIDPKRIAEANENVKKNAVGDRVKVLNQDLFATDISEAIGRHALSVAVAESEAAADSVEDAEARHPHRLARFRHGRLEAGADAERRRRDDLLLDDHAGSREAGG